MNPNFLVLPPKSSSQVRRGVGSEVAASITVSPFIRGRILLSYFFPLQSQCPVSFTQHKYISGIGTVPSSSSLEPIFVTNGFNNAHYFAL